jgi:hypothetical protein
LNKREFENLEAHYLSRVISLEHRLQDHRDLLREIVAYCREAGHDWLSLREADELIGNDEALKSTVGAKRAAGRRSA